MKNISNPFRRMLWESYKSIWRGNVHQYYGENKEFYKTNFGLPDGHNGIDIHVKYGEDLIACFDGWILKDYDGANSDLRKGYGIQIITDYDLGMYYVAVYWHNQIGNPLKDSDIVKVGDIIGKEGNSGQTYQGGLYCPIETRNKSPYCGAHLHFGIAEWTPCLNKEADNFHPFHKTPIRFLRWIDPIVFMNSKGIAISPALSTMAQLSIISQILLKLKEVINKIYGK